MRFHRRFVFCVIGLLLLGACAQPPEKQILGKWRMNEHQTIEFFPDKTVVLATAVKNFSGFYSIVAKDRIKIEFTGLGGLAGPQLARVSFQDGDLVLEGEENSALFSGRNVLKRIGG